MAFTVGAIAAKDGAAVTITGGLLAADTVGGGAGPWFLYNSLVDGVAGVNKVNVTAANALKIDGSAVTQPVSIATAPVLVAGAAIIGKVGIDQTTPGTTNLVAAGQNGTWTVQPGNTANTTAWKVDGSAVTQPVSNASLPLPAGASTSALQASRSQLHNTGTSNGSIIAPLTLTSGADLASLGSGAAVTLSGGGASGVSSQANTGSGQIGAVYFQTVTAGFTPTAGGNISIWWLFSPDGGTTYESTPATASTTVPALPRPPDCIIPLDAVALGTSAVKISLPCRLPFGTFKALVQNNSGAAFGAGNYTMKLVAFAENN